MCLGELLRSLIKDFPYYQFDRLRYVRNGINYYGKQVDIIKKIFNLKNHLLNKLKF